MNDRSCFVIQPIVEPFNKRYFDVYEPAIKSAGLDAYRVDQDPSVDDIVKHIQDGIRNSVICLAEISVDNPNVFYELGAAHAQGKDVVMVCERDRRAAKFPFDIAGRSIITYSSDSLSDFDKLRQDITTRISSFLKKGKEIQRLQNQPLAEVDGLEPFDQAALVVIAERDWPATEYEVCDDIERIGFRRVAAKLGIQRLLNLGFISKVERHDQYGEGYWGHEISATGLDWLRSNTDKIKMRKDDPVRQG